MPPKARNNSDVSTSAADTTLRELESKKLQLHWLLQITKAINYNIASGGLYEIYRNVLQSQLRVARMILLVQEDGWKVAAHYGCEVPDDLDQLAFSLSAYASDPAAAVTLPGAFETIVPVVHQDRPLAFALIGGIDEQLMGSKREIITYIHTITNVIVVAIENKRLAKESVERAVMQRELDMAAEMQSMLFPSDLISNSFLDIAATYIPHSSVGGDYYDFIPLDEHEALVCMADVSGKGMSAALLMSNFQANLRALVQHTDSLPDIVRELNERVSKVARGDRFITFFIARINTSAGLISYINAGHHPPLLVHDHEVVALDKGTTGLGMFDELPFLNQGEVHFPEHSVLFCYTDGVTEMENGKGLSLGLDVLADLLRQHKGAVTMQHMHEIMVKAFDEFRNEADFSDDVTFLSLRLSRGIKQ